jgi:hypothetical protein
LIFTPTESKMVQQISSSSRFLLALVLTFSLLRPSLSLGLLRKIDAEDLRQHAVNSPLNRADEFFMDDLRQ